MTENVRSDVIFCDDIRQEVNGKHLLIGVYSGDLVPGAPFPNATPLSVWIRLRGLEEGEHRFSLKLIDPDGAIALEIRDQLIMGGPKNTATVLAFGGVLINLLHPGKIQLMLSIDGEPEREIDQLIVTEAASVPDFQRDS